MVNEQIEAKAIQVAVIMGMRNLSVKNVKTPLEMDTFVKKTRDIITEKMPGSPSEDKQKVFHCIAKALKFPETW